MAPSLIAETSFLIDIEREQRADVAGPAHTFLARHPDTRLFVTETIVGEMASGVAPSGLDRLARMLAPFGVLPVTRTVALEYGRIYRYLSANGLLIGTNDLWIAASALAHEASIVTADADHFGRVPDLEVYTYRAT